MATILLVEDDDHQRLLYREELEAHDHTVVEAREGREALRSVRERPPDAVVLDINLPGMDGLDTLKRLHDVAPRLPVVINSAYSAYREQYVTWLADAYVVKSSNPAELLHAVETVLARRQAAVSER